MKLLVIKVDENDADYNTSINEISEEALKELTPVFKAIKGFKPYKGKSESGMSWTHDHNWPSGEEYCPRGDLGEKYPEDIYKDILTKDQIELFRDMCPSTENGFHSVESIIIYDVAQEEKIL